MVLYPPPTRMWKHCPECGIRLTQGVIDTPAPGHEPWCIVCSWKGIVGRLLVADASSRISCCQEQVQGMQQMQQTLQQQQHQMQQLQEMQEQMQEQLKQMQDHLQQGWQSMASLQDQTKQLEEQQWRLQYKIDEVQCHHRNTRLELLGKQLRQEEASAAAEERYGRMFHKAWAAAFEHVEEQLRHQMQQQQQHIMYLEAQVAAAAHNQGLNGGAILQLQQKVLNCQELLEAAAAAAEQQDQPHQSSGTPGAAVATEPLLPRRTSKTSKQPGSSSNSSDQGELLHQEPSQLVSKEVSK